MEKLRAAYEAGLKAGRSADGLSRVCPFEREVAPTERIAWLSGINVGRAVRLRSSH